MCAHDGHEGGKFGGNGLRSDANDRQILPPLPRSMIRASFFAWRRHGSFMNQTAGVFVAAVLAAFLIGMASAGAGDEPVATAPIPPLPAEPPSPDTPMMIPAASPPRPNSPGTKTDSPSPAAGVPKTKQGTAAAGPKQKPGRNPAATEHARRSKGLVSQHTATRNTRRRKRAAEKAGAAKTAAEAAAAAEAAEKDTARRRAAELGHEGYRGARRTRPQALPAPATWGAPPHGDMTYGNKIFGNRSYNGGTYPDRNPPPPREADGLQPPYDAQYPRPPMFYGPAYPPPGFNGSQPAYHPDRWGRGPMPPW